MTTRMHTKATHTQHNLKVYDLLCCLVILQSNSVSEHCYNKLPSSSSEGTTVLLNELSLVSLGYVLLFYTFYLFIYFVSMKSFPTLVLQMLTDIIYKGLFFPFLIPLSFCPFDL